MQARTGPEFAGGLRTAIPIVVAIAPFGLLFGALAVDQGLHVRQAVLMSATMYAGASQLVGLELFGQQVAPWLIVLSVFAVNFRHVLYSAALGRRIGGFGPAQKAAAFALLVDAQYAESERRAEQGLPITPAWYLGLAGPVYASWVALTWLGASFGSRVLDTLPPGPHGLGPGFLLPVYFLGLVLGFRGRPRWWPVVGASALASTVAHATVGSPWHVSIGAAVGIVLAFWLAGPGGAGAATEGDAR